MSVADSGDDIRKHQRRRRKEHSNERQEHKHHTVGLDNFRTFFFTSHNVKYIYIISFSWRIIIIVFDAIRSNLELWLGVAAITEEDKNRKRKTAQE